jgi:hypothetical protein
LQPASTKTNDLRRSDGSGPFSGDEASTEKTGNLRATIVIEHIIQTSDVVLTVTVLQVEQTVVHELYRAFKAGQMARRIKSEFWYQSLWFFSN